MDLNAIGSLPGAPLILYVLLKDGKGNDCGYLYHIENGRISLTEMFDVLAGDAPFTYTGETLDYPRIPLPIIVGIDQTLNWFGFSNDAFFGNVFNVTKIEAAPMQEATYGGNDYRAYMITASCTTQDKILTIKLATEETYAELGVTPNFGEIWYEEKSLAEAAAPVCKGVVLTVEGWTAQTQTVTVEGILADEDAQLILPMPRMDDQALYNDCGVLCVAQAENSLTFQCSSLPTADLHVYVTYQPVQQ